MNLPASTTDVAAARTTYPDTMKIATGELRSIKDGKYRRILPEWVDEYIRDQIERQEVA